MKKIFIALGTVLFLTLNASAQTELAPCGNGSEVSEWLDKYQANPALYPKTDQLLWLPLTIHIVGTSQGEGYFSVNQVYDALCKLNADFAPLNVQFFIEDDFNYINNTSYYDHNSSQGSQMMLLYNRSNTINCYIVDSPNGACGYYRGNRDAIALAKSCLGSNNTTWAHEIGHYLSLPHTFRGWEGQSDYDFNTPAPSSTGGRPVERVDGSNCATAADRFCDTPPDYLSDRWTCNDTLSAVLQTDPDGMTFRSVGTFIMSYANDACANRFSDEQIAAMRANIENQRTNLLYDQSDRATIEGPFEITGPGEFAQIPNGEPVTLSWTAAEGADFYFLELDYLPGFNTDDYQSFFLTENSYTFNPIPNQGHFWRVRPLSDYDGCISMSPFRVFVTTEVTATNTISAVNNWTVSPNPLQNGQELQLNLNTSQPLIGTISLWNSLGQKVQNLGAVNAPTGRQQMAFQLNDHPAGLYLVIIDTPEGRLSKKLMLSN